MNRRHLRTPSPQSHAPQVSTDSRHHYSPLLLNSHRHASNSSSNIHPSDTSTSPPPSMSDDDVAATTATSPSPPPKLASHKPSFPSREDCWSELATRTLIEEWGSHYLQLNRGNLTQKHWQQIADTVNAVHVSPRPRTDIQCKNRIDTVKKKYKIEKTKVSQSRGRYASSWPFFQILDSLIGSNYNHSNIIKASPSPSANRKAPRALPPPPSSVPVGPRSKRPMSDDAVFRRNFSAMAAAAAAVEAEGQEDEEPEEGVGEGEKSDSNGMVVNKGGEEGYVRKLAAAIERLGKIYERVEEAKHRQMVELEKQRMQFAKDLEVQRMKWYVDSQLHLKKIKRFKHWTSETG